MKALIALILAVGTLAVNAATSTTALTDAATNSVFTYGVKISNISIANAGTNVLTLALFDAPSTSLTWSHAAYTAYSNYVGNVTNTVVASSGVTNTYIYTDVILTATNTIAAATNSYVRIATLVCPASTTLTVPYAANLGTYQGLLMTNNAPGDSATVTITFANQK